MTSGIQKTMYKITKYKESPDIFINLEKIIKDEEKAHDYFEEIVREELDYEIEEGLISDQELQNIYSNMTYRFEDETNITFLEIEKIND